MSNKNENRAYNFDAINDEELVMRVAISHCPKLTLELCLRFLARQGGMSEFERLRTTKIVNDRVIAFNK